jgi:hypothetical protein
MRKYPLFIAFLCFAISAPAHGDPLLIRQAISAAGIDCASGTVRVRATLGGYPLGRYTAPTLLVMDGFWFPAVTGGSGVTELNSRFSFRFDQNRPNPFGLRTSIGYTVPGQAGQISGTRLEIFDIQGRLVVRLIDAPLAAGEHRTEWTGRDGLGRPVPAGTYYARLHVGNRTESHSLVLLK